MVRAPRLSIVASLPRVTSCGALPVLPTITCPSVIAPASTIASPLEIMSLLLFKAAPEFVPPFAIGNTFITSLDDDKSIRCHEGDEAPLLLRYVPDVPAAKLDTVVASDVYIISPAPPNNDGIVYADQAGVVEEPLTSILFAVVVPANICN